MSRRCVTAPPLPDLTMISPNSSTLCSRPRALTESCSSVPGSAGRTADHPGRRLNVLLTQRRYHIAGREATGGHLVGIEPDPHGIFPTTKDGHVPHPLDPGQSVTHIEQRIIALVVDVIAILR